VIPNQASQAPLVHSTLVRDCVARVASLICRNTRHFHTIHDNNSGICKLQKSCQVEATTRKCYNRRGFHSCKRFRRTFAKCILHLNAILDKHSRNDLQVCFLFCPGHAVRAALRVFGFPCRDFQHFQKPIFRPCPKRHDPASHPRTYQAPTRSRKQFAAPTPSECQHRNSPWCDLTV